MSKIPSRITSESISNDELMHIGWTITALAIVGALFAVAAASSGNGDSPAPLNDVGGSLINSAQPFMTEMGRTVDTFVNAVRQNLPAITSAVSCAL